MHTHIRGYKSRDFASNINIIRLMIFLLIVLGIVVGLIMYKSTNYIYTSDIDAISKATVGIEDAIFICFSVHFKNLLLLWFLSFTQLGLTFYILLFFFKSLSYMLILITFYNLHSISFILIYIVIAVLNFYSYRYCYELSLKFLKTYSLKKYVVNIFKSIFLMLGLSCFEAIIIIFKYIT